MTTKIKNLTGKRYGALLVTGFAFTNGRSHWNCICECGRKTVVASNNLRKTKVNQCGKCKSKPLAEAMSMIIMRDYRFRAWSKGLKFTISKQFFMDLLIKPCYYCSMERSNVKTRGPRTFEYNGIDRLNSRNGYVRGNVVTACKYCNLMKKDMTVLEFKEHVAKIFAHWAGK